MTLSDTVCSNRILFELFKPDKLVRLSRWVDIEGPVRILDLGCGGHSPRYFKTQFPHCKYTGVDHATYRNTLDDLSLADAYFEVNLDDSDLSFLPNKSYDLVVLSHVLEHLRNGRELLTCAASKVDVGGFVYVSHPHSDSVNFPHRADTLNFYDDVTHISIWSPNEARYILSEMGFEIIESGRTRLARNLLMMPIKAAISPFLGGVTGPMLWDLYGFEEFVIARNNSALDSQAVSVYPEEPAI